MMNWGLSDIYRNPLFNTPAPIGYGVTIPQDLRPYIGMGDRFYTTNYGWETQYGIFPNNYSHATHHVAQNPQLAYTDPLLLNLTDGLGSGLVTQDQVAADRISKSAPQVLASLEKQLREGLQSDKLTNAQKARIQAKLDEVLALKEKFQQALKNAKKEELYKLEEELKNLQKSVAELGNTLAQEIQDATPSTNPSTTPSPAPTTTPGTTPAETPATGRPEAIGPAPDESDCETICAAVLRAVKPAGRTDRATLEGALASLTAGNIIEVVQHWEGNYGTHTATGNEGFFAKIFDDIGDDDQNKYIPIILNLLIERAKANGMYDEIKQDVANVNKGLTATTCFGLVGWHDDHQLANDLMNIVNKIAAKEAQNKVKAENDNKAAKAEQEKKAAERKAQVVPEKKSEFANAMKKALNLPDLPALSTKLKIETDENGEFKEFSIELDTPNGKVTVKGLTYHALVLEIEKHGLEAKDVLIRPSQA